MRLTGLVRSPSPSLHAGVRTHLERVPINFLLATEQHAQYVQVLRDAGVTIVEVPAAPDLPDAAFIEDTALVLDSLAVIARSGAQARRAETAAVTAVLNTYCHLVSPPAAACFDGGDILTIDRTVYVGHTTRTNQVAIDFLSTLLRSYHYEVVPVPVSGCLHLKTAVTSLGENRVLINPQFVPREFFAKHLQIEVAIEEPMGANALRVGNHLLMSASYPRTAKRVEAHGLMPRLIDISEFHRAEGGLTCLSILLSTQAAS